MCKKILSELSCLKHEGSLITVSSLPHNNRLEQRDKMVSVNEH